MADTYGCYDQNVVGCMIYLAFCHPLPLDLGVDCYNAAVCQKEFYGNGTSKEISLGSFTNFIHFYSSKLAPYRILGRQFLTIINMYYHNHP